MMREHLHDLSELEIAICRAVEGQVCQNQECIAQLSRTVRYLVENDISGDFVECGVYRGASIICMIWTIADYPVPGSRLPDIWMYDTFEGMPKPEEIDRFHGEKPGETIRHWESLQREGGGSEWVRATVDDVKANVDRTGYPPNKLHYVKGMVEDTIPAQAPSQIALLRLDTDFYASTKHELEHLYPRVVPGGVVIIDDYGAFQGCKQAVDEYIKENGLKVLLSRIDEHVRMWVKP
jgi:O-methyltransferase